MRFSRHFTQLCLRLGFAFRLLKGETKIRFRCDLAIVHMVDHLVSISELYL